MISSISALFDAAGTIDPFEKINEKKKFVIVERKRVKKNDPRTCDIDIIDYNSQILNLKYNNLDFTIPHKELTSRNFVLFPLQEISPMWKHPKTKETISNLIQELNEEDKNSILKIDKN